MVFLCMNCCLPASTINAFGSPDLVAWHHGGEFKTSFGFTEPDFVKQKSDDYMACYVYGNLTQHFASAHTDSYGKCLQLNKDNRKWLVKNLKKVPTIVEVYSPPRVTSKAPQHGFTAGGALDLSTGWDLKKKEHQQAALRLIRETQPVLVILSPPCTTFSNATPR